MRDVFPRVASAARLVVDYDAIAIAISEAAGKVRVYAAPAASPELAAYTLPRGEISDRLWPSRGGAPTCLARASAQLDAACAFDRRLLEAGIESLLVHSLEGEGGPVGALWLGARTERAYTDVHAAAVRPIADMVALVIERDRAAVEALERRVKRDAIEPLLATIARTLDVRAVLPEVSHVIAPVLPHDFLTLRMLSPDGTGTTVHSSLRDRSQDAPAQHDAPATEPGGSELRVPVRLQDEVLGWITVNALRPDAYDPSHVELAQRIADHVALSLAHERLAEQASRTEELRRRTANLELLDRTLATLGEQAELKQVFDRISALTWSILPHDALVLLVVMPDGVHAHRYASSGLGPSAPTVIDVPADLVRNADWEYKIIDDAALHLDDAHAKLESFGLRASLAVPIRRDGRFVAGLAFVSRSPCAFRPADVLFARRVADRIALDLAREQETQASRRAREAAARAERLETRVRELTDELDARTGFRRIVGDSTRWRHVLRQAAQVAPTDATVLLLGESGTGKEVIARLLHRASRCADGPFVALNCAALPEHLLESELFGFERGAFTGAVSARAGRIEQAAGGVLFLDEVVEMSSSVQAKFLRVLQEREFQRLGGSKTLRTDARVIAATNRDPRVALARGTLREDLYYRLSVFEIALPPLRERSEDVLPLVEAFLAQFALGIGRPAGGLSEDARDCLLTYDWPGNVRELRNAIERAVILCDGGLITSEHLPIAVGGSAGAAARTPPSAPPADTIATGRTLDAVERDLLSRALAQARNNKSQAARLLGLPRGRLYSLLRRYGLTDARR